MVKNQGETIKKDQGSFPKRGEKSIIDPPDYAKTQKSNTLLRYMPATIKVTAKGILKIYEKDKV